MNKYLTNWYEATQDVAEEFIRKYIMQDDLERADVEAFWIGDQVGGMLCVNDQFISLLTMVDALRLECPVDVFHEWYSKSFDDYSAGSTAINLDHYLRMNDHKTNQK